jgi:hypothetical protein
MAPFGTHKVRDEIINIIDIHQLPLSPNISRVRDAHLKRYQGLAVVYYGCALECLTNERHAHVKYPGLHPKKYCPWSNEQIKAL